MRINNNIMAMNTHRQYGINNTNVSSSVEKLSSGYRINRAGDDAAGLAISEKMRAQIRGLNMASKNSQDAISLVQTAEGALQTTHDILQRMREIATQSASDTNESTIDRSALNKEFQALLAEIDDTASKTAFNDQKLIDGTFAAIKVDNADNTYNSTTGTATAFADALTIGGTTGTKTSTLTFAITGYSAAVTASAGTQVATGITAAPATDIAATWAADATTAAENDALNGTWTFAKDASGVYTATNGTKTITGSAVYESTNSTNASLDGDEKVDVTFAGLGTLTLTNEAAASAANTALAGAVSLGSITVAGATAGSAEVTGTIGVTDSDGNTYTLTEGQSKLQLANGVAVDFGATLAKGFAASDIDDIFGTTDGVGTWSVSAELTKGIEFVVQTGANKGDELSINIDKMDSKTLGVFASNVASREAASNAIKETNDAINKVSSQRADLGALQNRLEFKISNLDTSAENLQSAESRIRDLDMAKEMTEFTKNNILSQAATAMLAQANSLPQGVLQLLG